MAASDEQLTADLRKSVIDMKHAISRRNGLIRSLRRRGVALRKIAEAADLSHSRIDQMTEHVVVPRLPVPAEKLRVD